MQITALPIITMDQGALASGEALAGAAAKELGYGGISKEVIVEANRKYGIPRASRSMRVKVAALLRRYSHINWRAPMRCLTPLPIAQK